MKKTWQKGEDLPLRMSVRNKLAAGEPLFDPDTITLEARPPEGEPVLFRWPAEVGYEDLERLGLGKFQAKIPLTEAGVWRRQWRQEGPDFNESTPWTKFTVEDDPA